MLGVSAYWRQPPCPMISPIACVALFVGTVTTGCVVIRMAVMNAPRGYEDDAGFHTDTGAKRVLENPSDGGARDRSEQAR